MQYLTSQFICFSLITPLISLLFLTAISFSSCLFCFFLFYLYFSSVSTVLLLSTVPQVSLSSSTFTFSHLCRLFSVSVQELQRKAETWMMLFDCFWSHHSSKGPPSYHFFPDFPSVSVVFPLCLWPVTWLESFGAHCHLLVKMYQYPLFTRRKCFHLIFRLPFFTKMSFISLPAAFRF